MAQTDKKADFGTDPQSLQFDVTHNDHQTQIQVTSGDYAKGVVIIDADAPDDIPIQVGNGSAATRKLLSVSAVINPKGPTPIPVTLAPGSNGIWTGTLKKTDLEGLVSGELHVSVQWEKNSSGKKGPVEDPVIIVNPKTTP